jgi:hypothetical protein
MTRYRKPPKPFSPFTPQWCECKTHLINVSTLWLKTHPDEPVQCSDCRPANNNETT